MGNVKKEQLDSEERVYLDDIFQHKHRSIFGYASNFAD